MVGGQQEARELKDRHFKEPIQVVDDKIVLAARKSNFNMDKDPEFNSKHVTVISNDSKVIKKILKEGEGALTPNEGAFVLIT